MNTKIVSSRLQNITKQWVQLFMRNDIEFEMDDKHLLQKLAKIIELLPENEKLVLSLCHEKKLSFKQIGEVLGQTEAEASQTYERATQTIRQVWTLCVPQNK